MSRKREPPREPLALTQARQLIRLAKEEGASVLKVGEFFVQFGPAGEPHDAVGFEVSPTQDPFTEDADRRR